MFYSTAGPKTVVYIFGTVKDYSFAFKHGVSTTRVSGSESALPKIPLLPRASGALLANPLVPLTISLWVPIHASVLRLPSTLLLLGSKSALIYKKSLRVYPD